MSDEAGSDAAPVEAKPPRHAREHLWSAAFWAGAKYAEQIVEALGDSARPWYPELAPLTIEERVLVIGSLCQQIYPDMSVEQRGQSYMMLCRLYGLKNGKRGHGAH